MRRRVQVSVEPGAVVLGLQAQGGHRKPRPRAAPFASRAAAQGPA